MFTNDLDTHGRGTRGRAEDNTRSNNEGRPSTSTASAITGEESYTTAVNPMQRVSSGGTGSGLGISGNNSHTGNRNLIGSSSTVTAAAAGQDNENWPGVILRQTDVRVESRELASLDAELRRRTRRLPRDGARSRAAEREALSELVGFLRNVTPPPGNYMSLPDPTSPTTLSSMSSIRRRNSRKVKKGPLRMAMGLFRRGSKRKKLSKKRPSPSQPQRRSSPPLARSPSVKKSPPAKKRKRPPRIKLPDTAVAGKTVDGFRHIAISIPIEHAHLGPEPEAGSSHTYLDRHLSSSSSESSPKIYRDVNVRPMSAFVSEPLHVGTQLGPLVEERESLSSRSWERNSTGTAAGTGNGNGAGNQEEAAARKVRLASRNTFGTVHEEQLSRPTTSYGLPSPRASPGLSDEGAGPRTPRTSAEMRSAAHRQALAALGARPSSQPTLSTATGAAAAAAAAAASTAAARPSSGYSFRSFATPSPSGRLAYPARKSSLHPSPEIGGRRPGVRSDPDQLGRGAWQQQHSRDSSRDQTTRETDSSRDQTVRESIFSQPADLESLDTVETGRDPELRASPAIVSEATAARRFEGCDVVETPPRRSAESKRKSIESKRESGESKRNSESSSESTSGKGKKRASGGAQSEASAIKKGKKVELAPIIVSRELGGAVASDSKGDSVEAQTRGESTMRKPERRLRLVESTTEDPGSHQKGKGTGKDKEVQQVDDQRPSHGLKRQSNFLAAGIESQDSDGGKRLRTPPQEAETVVTKAQEEDGKRLSSGVGDHTQDDAKAKQKALEPSPLAINESMEASKVKAKQKETSPPRVTKESNVSKPKAEEGGEEKPPSPLPSPKQRREKRKSTLIWRKQRVAEMKRTLDQPGFQPEDLLWQRRLSLSSNSSESSSSSRASRDRAKRDTFPYPPGTTALAPVRPKPIPAPLSFTRVITVADVQPSSPAQTDLTRKDSAALSVSTPGTISTILKTSPVPPYRSLGSVTPPDSPPPSDASSQASFGDAPGTALRHPPSVPLKRINSRNSRKARHSPSSPALSHGRRSPTPTKEKGPSRPRAAGKGVLASKKDFLTSPKPDLSTGDSKSSNASGPPGSPFEKSVLKMSRSQIFDRYEALREKQTRDMEKRIRRLERNGEYWLKSMLPLLSTLSQTLGKLAVGKEEERQKDKGKGPEVEHERTTRGQEDGRQSRLDVRSENVEAGRGRSTWRTIDEGERSGHTLDRDEAIVHHASPVHGKRDTGGSERRRIYLQDHPDLGYRVEDRSATDDGRSFSLHTTAETPSFRRRHHHRARTTAPTADALQQQQPPHHHHHHQQRTASSTTMVDSTHTAAREPSRLQEEIARIERLNERVSARLRSLSLGRGASPPKSFAAQDRARGGGGGGAGFGASKFSEESDGRGSLETYDDTEKGEGDSGMETLEPLMRELQAAGSRLSMESTASQFLGDDEVRRMRQGPGPRAVVGFGAFSL